MDNKSFLCYVHLEKFIFDNADFNFDHKYVFHVEIGTSQDPYKCILRVSKRKTIIQPMGFFGENISTVNVITGQNGSGKTFFLQSIMNNIGIGLTAINREGVIYIINQNNKYIVIHNCTNFEWVLDKDAEDIEIIIGDEYWKQLSKNNIAKPSFSNEDFWRNIIFFSNYFGATGLEKYYNIDNYIIDVSRDKEISEMINSIKAIVDLKTLNIQNQYQRYRNMRLLNYIVDDESFTSIASNTKISMPNLLRIKFKDSKKSTDLCGEYKDKTNFPNEIWVGKKRFHKFFTVSGVLNKSKEFYFEAAINRFSVELICFLLDKNLIVRKDANIFFQELANAEDKTGIQLVIELFQNNDDKDIKEWINFLKLISNDLKEYILFRQGMEEFLYEWEICKAKSIKKILDFANEATFFSCDLVASEGNGHYSSGEESKLNLLMALYEALKRMEKQKKDNNNIILLIDEVDAYFHPKYQIDLVKDLLEIVSKIFKDYYVQLILTSNTPLEISDFPASNIIYLDKGKINEQQNQINTFGNNVCNLLKNSFYIDSTMGAFAKSKIDEVINFLNDENSVDICKDEVEYIISILGEDIIKNKLKEMYYKKYPDEIIERSDEIAIYKSQIKDLQSHIMNSKNIEVDKLLQLEDELVSLTDTIRKIME